MSENYTIREKSISITKQAIIEEAKRIEENCLYTAKGHFNTAQFWTNFNLLLGVPIVVLAAISSASLLSKFYYYNIIASILSMIILVLTSISTFLNPNERANNHLKSGNNYDSLLSRIRIFWSIDCRKENSDEILSEKLKDLSDRRDRLNRECPQVPPWAYKKAKKGIEAGESKYKVDNSQSPE